MMRVGILGAECTGKSKLAQSLSLRLSKGLNHATWIPEVLREWCNREGRTPLAHEQSDIALEQMRRIEAAPPCDFLLVDSPPLMTAIYSELYFSDLSLYPATLNHLQEYQLTLVMGMDLEWIADGIQRDGPVMRRLVNQRLRQVLDERSLPYTVIYGMGSERIDGAIRAIEAHTTQFNSTLPTPSTTWVWHCDNCSDARCEHRMFTDQLQIERT
jgi:HTH-type transcriptional repressor of NAD biosynthesis genes